MLGLLAANAAFSKDVGLIAVFGGIGVFATAIIAFIFVQVRGESQQNKQRPAEQRSRQV